MTDYIDRQAAIDALYHVDEYNGRSIEAIKELPSADAVPVVRCKDCKHRYAPSYQDGVEWLSLYCPHCGAKMGKEEGEEQ